MCCGKPRPTARPPSRFSCAGPAQPEPGHLTPAPRWGPAFFRQCVGPPLTPNNYWLKFFSPTFHQNKLSGLKPLFSPGPAQNARLRPTWGKGGAIRRAGPNATGKNGQGGCPHFFIHGPKFFGSDAIRLPSPTFLMTNPKQLRSDQHPFKSPAGKNPFTNLFF